MEKTRIIKYFALVAGFFLVALFVLVLVSSRIIDSEAVKSKVRDFVAEKTTGLARIGKIEFVWFPRPGAVIRDAAISFGPDIQGSVQQLRLYPSMRHLLAGSWAISSVTADGAAWVVRLPAPNDEPFNLDEVEEKIRAAVQGLASGLPGMNLRIRSGSADIGFAGGRSLMITDIDARLDVTLDKLAFTIAASSNLADKMRLEGEITAGKLASEGRLAAQNVDLRKLVEFVSPASSGWLDDGAATLSLEFRAAGLKNFSATIAGSLPSLTLARGSRKALIKTKDFKAIVTGDEKEFRFIVESLPLVSPPLNAAGELTLDRKSPALSVKLTGRDLEVGPIRESALRLAGDVTSVQNTFRYLQSGTIPELRVDARGRSLADAINNHAAVSADFHGAKILVSGPDLDLENVRGSLSITAGVLECRKCSATLGKAKAGDGALRIDLKAPGGAFHLDIMVEADARELRALLVRHVKDQALQKELSRVRHVDGSLSGRLVLGETLDAISAKVSVVPAGLTVAYEPVPYSISLKRGRLNYENGKIEAESLEGAIGRSLFSGLTGSLRTDGTEQLNIKSAALQLNLEETELLLRKVDTVQAKLGPEISAKGKVDILAISLTGPLNDPSRWDFRSKGKVEGVVLRQGLLPAPLFVTQGTFDATHEKLAFVDAKIDMLDASMTGGGVVENWDKPPLRVNAMGSGVAGGRMMEWARHQMEISADFMLRAPLEFSSAQAVWRADGDYSFKGQVTVAKGPELSIDMERNVRSLTIKELSIDAGALSARTTFELDKDQWSLAFSGTLDQPMLERTFLTPPVRIGLLQGDFAVNAFNESPFRLSARGTLAAKELVLSPKGEDAVIERIDVQADGSVFNIQSSDLRWRGSHISLSGRLTAAQQALQVDLDIAADHLAWEKFSELTNPGVNQQKPGNGKFALPPLEGAIRLQANRFTFGAFSWNPLRVKALLTANGITAEVEDSVVCGIRTAGRFATQKDDRIDLDVRLSVRDGDLDATSRCLSSENSNVSGTYNLDARVAGGGNRDRLASTLTGEFAFVARDGKFVRSAPLDATFDYLNDTGDFNVTFPDLNKEAFPYRFISVKGTGKRQSIFATEIIIEALPYAITAQGSADLERKTIDGKGLVTVLLPGNKILKRTPLVGALLSASMIGIPIEVTGPFEQPRVSYLSPAALGAEIISLPVRILKVPWEALQIFTPSAPGSEKN